MAASTIAATPAGTDTLYDWRERSARRSSKIAPIIFRATKGPRSRDREAAPKHAHVASIPRVIALPTAMANVMRRHAAATIESRGDTIASGAIDASAAGTRHVTTVRGHRHGTKARTASRQVAGSSIFVVAADKKIAPTINAATVVIKQ